MHRYFLAAGLMALLAGCSEQGAPMPMPANAPKATAPAPAVDELALKEQAQAAAQALGSALQTELAAAITSGGPVAAMSVCQIKAPELAAALSEEQGMTVKRVSLRNRNPVMGVPNEWETQVLNDFEASKAAGESPATLVYAATVANEFRFMQAIPTAAVCLTCHGTDLSPAVKAALAELYPQDRATGYKEGDLRGAFVVVKNLAQ